MNEMNWNEFNKIIEKIETNLNENITLLFQNLKITPCQPIITSPNLNKQERKAIIISEVNEKQFQKSKMINIQDSIFTRFRQPQNVKETLANNNVKNKMYLKFLSIQPTVTELKIYGEIINEEQMIITLPAVNKNNKQMWWMYYILKNFKTKKDNEIKSVLLIPMNNDEKENVLKQMKKMHELCHLIEIN